MRKNAIKAKWTKLITKPEQPLVNPDQRRQGMKPFPIRNHTNIIEQKRMLSNQFLFSPSLVVDSSSNLIP
jgi:hypothetical protein